MKQFSELTPTQQESLKQSVRLYQVQIDPYTNKEYVRFMGEDVDYKSILNSQMLLG